jgi:hypothetical protein
MRKLLTMNKSKISEIYAKIYIIFSYLQIIHTNFQYY